MGLRNFGMVAVQLVVVLAALSLVLGSVFGQPIFLSYVETGSMSPTLEPGDGFIAVPAQVDSSAEEGDVVVFRAEELNGGGLTTHRIVDNTEHGFITKGDANPFTDQSDEEPPVKRAQVVAQALQVNGHVVVIPYLGTVVEGTQSVLSVVQRKIAILLGISALLGTKGLAYLIFAGAVLWYVVGEWRAKDGKRPDRVTSRMTGIDSRLVMGAFAAMLVVGVTAAMVVPAGTQQYGVVSAEFTSERPNVIPMGESKSQRYTVGNSGFLPVVTYLEPASEGVEIRPHELYVEGQSVANAIVTLHAPDETGYYRRFVTEHRYLAILPPSVIDSLYRIHPWAPIVAIDALIGIPFYIFGITLLGTGRIRNRSRSRDLSTLTRIRRAIRNLY
ncbi:signal peptidase I [Halobellus sp. H-GB7]|uniref:signal peptidase I n=1 Tax=Halobellus sp. H-GB7 TaxID=3069756 RepID=UPI0027AECD94|nr:signal peptidase I [Halobellus sp. H-GB7]MDQ2054471.1 signal peptidase I [Halobellus sp. H-GB7]